MASPLIEERTGVSIDLFDLAPAPQLFEYLAPESIINVDVSSELLLVPGLIMLAIIVGFLPAFAAYRTDVARSLGASP